PTGHVSGRRAAPHDTCGIGVPAPLVVLGLPSAPETGINTHQRMHTSSEGKTGNVKAETAGNGKGNGHNGKGWKARTGKGRNGRPGRDEPNQPGRDETQYRNGKG